MPTILFRLNGKMQQNLQWATWGEMEILDPLDITFALPSTACAARYRFNCSTPSGPPLWKWEPSPWSATPQVLWTLKSRSVKIAQQFPQPLAGQFSFRRGDEEEFRITSATSARNKGEVSPETSDYASSTENVLVLFPLLDSIRHLGQ